MSEVMNQAEELRQKMIALLVAERQAIDEKLVQIGCGASPQAAKKSKACSICGSGEHNARTCDQRKTSDAAQVQDSVQLNLRAADCALESPELCAIKLCGGFRISMNDAINYELLGRTVSHALR